VFVLLPVMLWKKDRQITIIAISHFIIYLQLEEKKIHLIILEQAVGPKWVYSKV